MSKASEAIEGMNETQKNAMKALCGGQLEEAKKGWYYTERRFHGKTAHVMAAKGLIQESVHNTDPVIKATPLGRSVGKLLLACLVMFMLTSCADKIGTAKLVLGFVNVGATVANTAFDMIAAKKKAECLKNGAEGSAEYVACYKKTADMMAKVEIIKPKLQKGLENASQYIKAVESGKSADYETAVKGTVCLLTEIYDVLPDGAWKTKVAFFINLAGAYACNKTANMDPERAYRYMVAVRGLMQEMLGQRG